MLNAQIEAELQAQLTYLTLVSLFELICYSALIFVISRLKGLTRMTTTTQKLQLFFAQKQLKNLLMRNDLWSTKINEAELLIFQLLQ